MIGRRQRPGGTEPGRARHIPVYPVGLGRGQQLFANASAVPRPKTVSTARRCATCARTQDGVP